MDKSSTYPHFHISTATICRFVRTYITIFTNKIAQFQHMGEFTHGNFIAYCNNVTNVVKYNW